MRTNAHEGPRVVRAGRVTLAIAIGAAIAGCTAAPQHQRSTGRTPHGVYRTAVPDLGLTDGLDPTGEYSSVGWEVLSGLVRTLVTYRHVAGEAGDVPVPDLATALPVVTDGGTTYTFRLKDGIRFAPPVDREITSHDIEYAFERIDASSLIAQYGQFYDGTIVGMDGPHPGPPRPISGIATPDDRTIVFRLTRPTGDFLYRLAMPATAPFPVELGRCFTDAGSYGRDIVATGPYMYAGSADVRTSPCSAIRPAAGFDPDHHVVLVRDPAYEASTDSPTVRSNAVDGIDITIDTDLNDIFLKIRSGELDGTLNSDSPPPDVLRDYVTDPGLRPLVHSNAGDFTSYISMNLTTPPFDDVHVRQAVAAAVDRAGLLRIIGGSMHGQVATHIVPPSILVGSPDDFSRYPPDGSVTDARAEMKRSRYDSDGDGMCDDDACRNVLLLNLNIPPYTEMEPLLVQDLARIGIDVVPKELAAGAAFARLGDASARVPIAMFASYGKDYADPFSFLRAFTADAIQPSGGVNASLVGLTRSRAAELGIPYPPGGVPSIDADVATCEADSGAARLDCWAALDRRLTQDVVAWVPYAWLNVVTITAPTVTRFAFDQFSGNPSFTQMVVENDVRPGLG
jgi:peptide/nickel transport system substrate-binding protein